MPSEKPQQNKTTLVTEPSNRPRRPDEKTSNASRTSPPQPPEDEVDEASDESFPASDPPAYTPAVARVRGKTRR